jgi:predicted esterase
VQRRPRRYGGLLVFSGGLIGPPGTTWTTAGSLEGTAVFLGCSDIDSHIPRQRVAESAEVFRQAGAEVTERIYPGMGHTINEDELEFARGLIASVVAEDAGGG